jgi:DNA mismatch repair protein MutS
MRPSPVRKQYLEIKRQFPEAIVFFRLGDFYETFDADAELVVRELDIVLTSRNVSKSQRVPMAGVPHHAAEGYIARLIEKGYHVAICDQISDEPINGLMQREVVRVVTPGTVTEPGMLPAGRNNYLLAVAAEAGRDVERAGLAYADISTGEFAATEFDGMDVAAMLHQEITRLSPRECLLPEASAGLGLLPPLDDLHVTTLPDWRFDPDTAAQAVLDHFGVLSLDGFGLGGARLATAAAGAIIQYLRETQRTGPALGTLSTYTTGDYMLLDAATRRGLELTETIRGRQVRGSLLGVLDRTVTPMGGRLLRQWLGRPLLDLERLERRLDLVAALCADGALRASVVGGLRSIGDLERLTNRVVSGVAGPRELVGLRETLEEVPVLGDALAARGGALADLAARLDPLEQVSSLIATAIVDEPPATLGGIGVIRPGFSQELDEIVRASQDAREWIASLEGVERRRTGIKSLKVGFNKVFGYYIEVSKPNLDLVPDDYIRKQTLVNAERFITPDLKEYEALVLNAEEEIGALEARLFREVCREVAGYSDRLLGTARTLARLDVVAALAEVAARNGYTRPTLRDDDTLIIRGGRHPVVEQWLEGRFVPNDVAFEDGERIHIVTGPNMSGKSTFLRQVALIVLLAQIGSFVPADEAVIGLVDRIFTRVGAQDEIHAGQSTFMVEMTETAYILQHATPRSLIILDEIGRGTSTYDGLAIARAIVEYLHNHPRLGAKTLFATHYHELTEMANILPRVANYNVAVAEQGGEVVFLHRIVPGGADRSYGIYVARLAGVPKSVVERADEILRELESQHNVWAIGDVDETGIPTQLAFFSSEPHPAIQELRQLVIEEMSPIDAITKLYELRRWVEGDAES